MKEETKNEMLSFLKLRDGIAGISEVSRLFDIYSKHEILTYDDLERQHSDFRAFIMSNLKYFESADEDYLRVIRAKAHQCTSGFVGMFDRSSRLEKKENVNFAHAVERVVGKDKSSKILEVGSGVIPASSIILGKDGYDITSMDEFKLPYATLMRFNVKSCRQYFNENTPVGKYDIVVGRKPCLAIRSIVERCTVEKVPYFMRLCACASPKDSITSWHSELRRIDGSVKFHNSYAYNLNNASFTPDGQIEEIIDMDDEAEIKY